MFDSFQSSVFSDVRLLHLVWEPASRLVGGLGVAAAGLCDALREVEGVSVDVISPDDAVLPARTVILKRTENINHRPVRRQPIYSDSQVNSYGLTMESENAQALRSRVISTVHLLELDIDDDEKCLEGRDCKVTRFTEQVSKEVTESKVNYTAVHAHDWMTAAAGVWMQKHKNVPLILHIHSTHMDRVGAHAKGAVYEHEKWAMEQADVIIAVSSYTKDKIVENYGISPERIRVILNASCSGEVAVAKPALDRSTRGSYMPTVLFAGRLESQKSPMLALEIMAAVLRRVEGARGMIAGGGEMLDSIRKVVKFKNMEDRIDVLGKVPHQNMPSVYRSASVVIMPSVSEPFGLVALEAAREGVAVLLSDRCGCYELLRSAIVNDLYDVGAWTQDVVNLLEDSKLRETQVKQQLEDIGEYSWNDVSSKVLGILEELKASE